MFIGCAPAVPAVLFTMRGIVGMFSTILDWLFDFTGWLAKVIWSFVMNYFFLR